MKLILLADVTELGRRGDIVDVSDGYARNYLLPGRKAVRATEGSVRQAERSRQARMEAELAELHAAQRVAVQLAGTRVVLAAQAGDEGRLYGSINTADVVEGVRKFTGVTLERRVVDIRKPIKAIGLHEVWITLHPEVEFPITLDVIPA